MSPGQMGEMLASSFYQLLKNLQGQGKRKEQYPMSHKACSFICKNLLTVSCDTRKMNKTRNPWNSNSDMTFYQNLD